MASGVPHRPAVVDVDAATLHSWLERGEVVLVDVREQDGGERIAGAHVVPYSRLERDQLPPVPAGKRLVLHCAVGVRSKQGGQELLAAGVTDVHHLAGGIRAWKAAGFPIE
jgi:rhodanese-related sulfurtransferase